MPPPSHHLRPQTRDIATAMLRWARARPDAIAVIDGDAVLTRRALLRWSVGLARRLRRHGPPSGAEGPAVCALLLPRSWAVPCGLFAARLAGLAFLPIDADAPPARVAAILRQARPAALIAFADSPTSDMPAAARLEVPPPHPALETLRVAVLEGARRLPAGAGHLVFTSGSSGVPKGVILRDAPLLDTAAAQRGLMGLDDAAAVAAPSLWALSPGFDASLSDIFCALLGPAPLLVFRDAQTRRGALAQAVIAHGVGRADLAPALLRLIPPEALPLQALIFGGERCDPAAARRWGHATRALQAYGPTEAAVCAMMARGGSGWRTGLLGRPLPHQIVLLVTDDGLYRVLPRDPDADVDDADAFNATRLARFDAAGPAPDGPTDGEIWLAGDALAIGYLDAPEEEARRFGSAGGTRVFRTGDRARWQDGALLWRGRTDRRLKRGGCWLEPEAVEAVAEAVWGRASLCLPWRGGLALALEEGGAGAVDAIPARIAARLGAGHRPRATVLLGAWPRLASGKTDVGVVTAEATRLLERRAAQP